MGRGVSPRDPSRFIDSRNPKAFSGLGLADNATITFMAKGWEGT
jgi:hypothetical protein